MSSSVNLHGHLNQVASSNDSPVVMSPWRVNQEAATDLSSPSYKLELLNDYEDDVTDEAAKNDYINICAANLLARKMCLNEPAETTATTVMDEDENENDDVAYANEMEKVFNFNATTKNTFQSTAAAATRSMGDMRSLKSGSVVSSSAGKTTEFTTCNLFRQRKQQQLKKQSQQHSTLNDTHKREFKASRGSMEQAKYMTVSQASLLSGDKESRLFDFFNPNGDRKEDSFHSAMRSKSEGLNFFSFKILEQIGNPNKKKVFVWIVDPKS
jgi:hypothetical protein